MSTRSRRPSKPRDANGLFSLGSVEEQRGQFARAREHLAAALALDTTLAASVHSLLARMLWAEQKWPEAIVATDLALASNSQNFLAHIVRSRCCSALGRMREACESGNVAGLVPEELGITGQPHRAAAFCVLSDLSESVSHAERFQADENLKRPHKTDERVKGKT